MAETTNPQFNLVVPITGYTIRKDAKGVEKYVLTGLASNTDIDLTGERMAKSAITAMAKSIETNKVYLNNEHGSDWDDDFGEVTKLWPTANYELMMEAELDPDHYRTKTLIKALDKGKKLGLSIGGYVLDAAKEFVDEVGAMVVTYKDISLFHVAITGTPAVAETWVTPITKSVKDWKETPMPKTEKLVEKTDEQVVATPEVSAEGDAAQTPGAAQVETTAEAETTEAPAEVATEETANTEAEAAGESATESETTETAEEEATTESETTTPEVAAGTEVIEEAEVAKSEEATDQAAVSGEEATPAESTETAPAEGEPSTAAEQESPETSTTEAEESLAEETTETQTEATEAQAAGEEGETAATADPAPDQADAEGAEVEKSAIFGGYVQADVAEVSVRVLTEELSWKVWGAVYTYEDEETRTPEERKAFIAQALREYSDIVIAVASALIDNGIEGDPQEAQKQFVAPHAEEVAKSITALDEKTIELTKSLTEKSEELTKVSTSLVDKTAELETTKQELTKTSGELATATTDLATANTKLETIKARKGFVFDKFAGIETQKSTADKEMQSPTLNRWFNG